MSLTGTTENVVVVNRFDLEIDNVQLGQVLSVDGIGDSTEVIAAPAVTARGAAIQQKVAGNTTYTDVTFTLHMTDKKYMSDWLEEVQKGKFGSYRRNGSVIMYDTQGKEQVRANFVSSFPTSVGISSLAAGTNEPVTVSVTLAHEGIKLVFKS